jgi:hypothetical protein
VPPFFILEMKKREVAPFILVLLTGTILVNGCIEEVFSPLIDNYASLESLEQRGKHSDNWEAVYRRDIAKVSSEWNTPLRVKEINSPGWEDGAYISSDGGELYFAYTNINLFKLPQIISIGPPRDKSSLCNPPCGEFPRVDVFYSKKDSSGKWQSPLPHPLTINYPIGGIVFVSKNKAYFMKYSNTSKDDIWYADFDGKKWNQTKIDGVNSLATDADPYVTPADDEMFFWSDRPSELGGKNIFYSKRVDGEWQSPQVLPAPVNSEANDMQPFLFRDTLYFSSDREGKLKIYKSVKGENEWSIPEVVVESKNAVGEPTLTGDGKYLYFIQLFISDEGIPNPEIMYTQRK